MFKYLLTQYYILSNVHLYIMTCITEYKKYIVTYFQFLKSYNLLCIIQYINVVSSNTILFNIFSIYIK